MAQAVSSEAARTLQQLQSQLEALPQPRQATGHSHRMCWALAPPAHATAGGEPQRFPDNCIDGDLLVRHHGSDALAAVLCWSSTFHPLSRPAALPDSTAFASLPGPGVEVSWTSRPARAWIV